MIIIVLLLALLAFWIWSLVKMPSKRAREIFEADGEAPAAVSALDRAFVVDLYTRFGTSDFRLKAIEDHPLDPAVAERFGVSPVTLDNRDELGVRLPHLKLLVSFEPGRYRLTEDAAHMAKRLGRTQTSLENANHG
ncbi:hypothetical protein [Henriciella aquimarina]|uniref:hypothetical protein n=1 Tax=Henriciella aquimarina TaxID=545261 RepID=UPI000A04FE75|nr:hypothetical protein [Henriciella aquimarina]